MLGHVSKYCKKSLNTNRSNNGQTKNVYNLTVCDQPDQTQNTETSDNEQNQNSNNTDEDQTETVYCVTSSTVTTQEILNKIKKDNQSKLTDESVSLPKTNQLEVNFGFGIIPAIFGSGTSISFLNANCIPQSYLQE